MKRKYSTDAIYFIKCRKSVKRNPRNLTPAYANESEICSSPKHYAHFVNFCDDVTNLYSSLVIFQSI